MASFKSNYLPKGPIFKHSNIWVRASKFEWRWWWGGGHNSVHNTFYARLPVLVYVCVCVCVLWMRELNDKENMKGMLGSGKILIDISCHKNKVRAQK